MIDVPARRVSGSSPLTRGKRSYDTAHEGWGRLIPAHAGKTFSSRSTFSVNRAHPRSRGENLAAYRACVGRAGSSPLTRGKRRRTCRLSSPCRLIPAHAGKTDGAFVCIAEASAHPRSRGENSDAPCVLSRGCGSSPLTRGKHLADAPHPAIDGLIPAHAGKTPARDSELSPNTAHPRSRGENRGRSSPSFSCTGSSPLTRGKPDLHLTVGRPPGLIPAHAGKTILQHPGDISPEAHPRSRGENLYP